MAAEAVLAVDVALLLPEEAAARVGELNRRLRRSHPESFAIDGTHLAHVTLLQQGVAAREVTAIAAALAALARAHEPLALAVTGAVRGRSTVHLLLAPDAALARLHEEVVARLAPWARRDVSVSSFVAGAEPPRERDIEWVSTFREAAAGPSFRPHVTFGIGEVFEVEPFSFTASRLALCQLGRHCTCRVVLAGIDLVPRGL